MTPSIHRRLAVARAECIALACLSIFNGFATIVVIDGDGVDIGVLLSNWEPCS